MKTRGRGRPVAEAPEGMVTIRQAAALTGVGPASVYRRVVADLVRYKQSENGTVYIDERDLSLLSNKRPKTKRRVNIWLRVTEEQRAAWLAAAGNKKLTLWVIAAADKSSDSASTTD